ncbi:Chemotaxis CheY-like receiver protein [Melioribacter roseus P3M-2]|jgi:sigma-B regulation protein RsbU (phosphoserine phosphatase)|uniref:histidine kinase n=1 Tax=Melioribacter roseus (strain DSM 23840 / JCM 17771 / VKM B-2668 / P3M-2) TaxID=1191523 RepID=I7A2K3_MELRP|nr:response regulator [Melioribacter roseus]AFN75403.1 Chemotaxis CheY-like receiver protein [Melioribacter roseus P3M-2]
MKDKILVVEDEKDTRFILEKLLTRNNYEVATAINGEDALEILKNFSPKVILADWTMPVLDGLSLCNILKADEKFKSIYFIILTARSSLKDRIMGLDIGADDFLVKPVENQELLARIRSGIRIYNLQNELKNAEHSKAVVDLACTIGHKINNPLSSLMLSLKSIENELNDDSKSKLADDLKVMKESVERINKFVQQLIYLKNPQVIDYIDENRMIKTD